MLAIALAMLANENIARLLHVTTAPKLLSLLPGAVLPPSAGAHAARGPLERLLGARHESVDVPDRAPRCRDGVDGGAAPRDARRGGVFASGAVSGIATPVVGGWRRAPPVLRRVLGPATPFTRRDRSTASPWIMRVAVSARVAASLPAARRARRLRHARARRRARHAPAPTAPSARGDAPPEGMNDEQRAAILAQIVPMKVLASPGSGKTRVLVGRVTHPINEPGPPSHILCITSPTKPPGMRERLNPPSASRTPTPSPRNIPLRRESYAPQARPPPRVARPLQRLHHLRRDTSAARKILETFNEDKKKVDPDSQGRVSAAKFGGYCGA